MNDTPKRPRGRPRKYPPVDKTPLTWRDFAPQDTGVPLPPATTESALDLRALDVLVAEHVFGIDLRAVTPTDIGKAVLTGMTSNIPKGGYDVMSFDWGAADDFELTYQGSKFNYGGADGNDGYGLWFWEQREGMDWQPFIEAHVAKWRRPVKHYTSTWDAAGQVVERMHELGWEFDVSGSGDFYEARFTMLEEPKATVYYGSGDTFPLAICLAALAALGVRP